ncbi:MAG: TIGR04282 family arsenosugar biosynthesis glycosyltransferase [Candidatus Sericytochromatia bacterium]|nr:TIGR04282 family arsenosugar biosynthesis glycosyltransferase [Candidatus Sericytochromatia bacterium]
MKDNNHTCLILLSRSPAAEPVKTRLAKESSSEFAQTLYSLFLQDLAQTLQSLELPIFVCYTPDTALAGENLSDLLSPIFEKHPNKRAQTSVFLPQGPGRLETRMDRAFAHCFERGFDKVTLIGGDLPDLPAARLKAALEALEHHDWVLGPSLDGGYYLVACTAQAFQPGLLDWQALPPNAIYLKTCERLRQNNLRVYALPPWQDVDTLTDLKDLVNRHAKTNAPPHLPPPTHTLAWLATQTWPNQPAP